jgi:hypothetical protein
MINPLLGEGESWANEYQGNFYAQDSYSKILLPETFDGGRFVFRLEGIFYQPLIVKGYLQILAILNNNLGGGLAQVGENLRILENQYHFLETSFPTRFAFFPRGDSQEFNIKIWRADGSNP